MYLPERFWVKDPEYFFINDIFIAMDFIWTYRIINYDISCPEKYPIYPHNFHIIKICRKNEIGVMTKEQFSRINSVDKISWHNFLSIIFDYFPEFDEKKFIKNMRKARVKKDDYHVFFAIFLDDIDYQERKERTKENYQKIFLQSLSDARKDWWLDDIFPGKEENDDKNL